MKTKLIKAWVLVSTMVCLPLAIVIAQDSVSYSTSIEFTTLKFGEGSRSFTAILTATGDSGEFPVYKGEIQFISSNGQEKVLIGKAITNEEGKAVFEAPSTQKYLRDKTGLLSLSAIFTATSAMSASEATVTTRDLFLKMELTEQDSTKTISVTAFEIDNTGIEVPLKEADVVFYIGGLFSKLKIGDASIADGTCSFDFPTDLRGDERGNLIIYARIEDHSDFGTVEVSSKAQWGQHRSNYVDTTRQLWTKGAPIWMIITLTILLIGVWSHYVYAIVQLILIKKEGKKISSNK